ncbi:Nsp1-like C-terminal region-domain-containing protein [Aspergillus pseudoustus]|uniref:Nsp1-like C-terminal region-domain-containing protein n=1 Tax=Aspergillus pseudoustus TaxID=1810923 RepID=A0ABR4JUI2_9EURO
MSNIFSLNKTPGSSGASSGGLFGSAGATTNTGSGGGLFGNVGATTNSSAAPAFGAPSSSNTGSSALFGSGTTGGVGGSTPTFSFGNLGSANAASGTQSPVFGAASQTPKPTEASTSGQTAIGGLFSAASKPSGGGLFGNNTATPSQSSTGSLFPSTTPAGPPPQGNAPAQGQSLFGQKPGGLFSNTSAAQPSAQLSAPASSTSTPALFGAAAPSAGSSLFGKTPQQSASGNTSSSGASGGGLFSLNKPAESSTPATTTDNAPKSPFPTAGAQTTSLFSAASSGANTATKPAFPSLASNTNTQTDTSSATPQKPLFSGLGGQSSSATPSSTPAAAPSGGLFPGLGASKPTESPSSQAAAPTGSLFSKPAGTGTSASTSTAATGTTVAGTSTGTTATATGTGTTTATRAPAFGASTAGPAPPAQSRLKNKTMDEIITRWANDLSKYQKEFREQAEKVAEWDRMLVENGTKVQKLYGNTVDAERATQEVERQLASVEGQQEELSSWLDRYEREVDEMMSKQVGPGESLQGPDQERERTYKLAEKLSERLDEMGKDLSGMVEEVNSASATLSKTNKADEPISQIVRILNSHLSQLQTIDQGTTELQTKVAAAQKAGQAMSSRFGHGYSMSGSGNGNAADDFYRSYMGRR